MFKEVAYNIVPADNGDAWIEVNEKYALPNISVIVLEKSKPLLKTIWEKM